MKRLEASTFFLVIFALYLAASLVLIYRVEYVSQEVNVRSGIAVDLLRGNERGREALICSVWWAPLPTLLQLPMGGFTSLVTSGVACGIISAAGGALACLFLLKTLIYCGVRRPISYGILALVALNPWMLFYSSSGSCEALLIGVLSGTLWCFALWYYEDRLSGLVGLSILAALLPLIKHQAILFTLVILACAVAASVMKGRPRLSRFEGTIFLTLSPMLYTVGLWFLFNWLIMGDFAYFLRGVYVNPIRPEATGELGAAYAMLGGLLPSAKAMDTTVPFLLQFLMMPFLPAAVVLLVASFVRRRSIFLPIFVGLLAAMPLYHFFMMPRQQSFDVARDTVVVVPICVFLAASALRGLFRQKTVGLTVASICVLILILAGTIGSYAFIASRRVDMPLHGSSSFPFVARKDVSSEEKEIKDFILDKELDSKIAIVGFQGYNFIKRADGGTEFIHSINLNLPLILRNTRGKTLYILVPRPAGLAAFDDINLELPDLYYLGETTIGSPDLKAHFMIENRDFPNWRVYSIVRPRYDESIFGTVRTWKKGS